MKKIDLPIQILIGVVLGIVFGFFFGEYAKYVTWTGDIFIRALKMLVAPLILSSIITGIISIGDSKDVGRIGFKVFGWYIMTGIFSILTGLFLVNLIQPGEGVTLNLKGTVNTEMLTQRSVSDIFMEIIPTNIFEALTEDKVLSIVFFALLFGFYIIRIENKYRDSLTDLFTGIFNVMMQLTILVIKFAPIGIFGIITGVVAEYASDYDQLLNLVKTLGLYSLTIFIGLFMHAFIYLPTFVKVMGRANPWKLFKGVTSALLTAFSTSSSNAALALTMDSTEKNIGISKKTANLVLPIGATLNTDGTALYECVAAVFIAQMYGIHLSFADQFILVTITLLTSLGVAGIPMSGLIMLTVILSAVGLPLEGISIIMAVDRFLDMFRTCVNVWSDCCGITVIAKSEGEVLKI